MHRLAAILLALLALIGAPQRAMARAVSNEKTASGNFSANSSLHARLETPQVLDRVPETSPRDYEPAPGRPKWLNRDPLNDAERLEGPNLYRALRNAGTVIIDTDGRGTTGAAIGAVIGGALGGAVGATLGTVALPGGGTVAGGYALGAAGAGAGAVVGYQAGEVAAQAADAVANAASAAASAVGDAAKNAADAISTLWDDDDDDLEPRT